MSKQASKRTAGVSTQPPIQSYYAGCGRYWDIASHEHDLAYTALEFPECPTCPHRVEPEGAGGVVGSFCTLRPRQPHPFAVLAGLLDV